MKDIATRPVIAVDIDDVLFPFVDGIAEYHNAVKGTSLTASDFLSNSLLEVFGGTADETENIIRDFLETNHLRLQPVAGAKEALARLKKDFTVVLVTARNQIFEPGTTQWLQYHFPDLFEHVIFAGNPYDGRSFRSKGVICKELGAQLLIDDQPTNLLSAVEHGVEGVLFGTQAWSVLNQSLPSEKITPCADWEAVMRYVYDERG